MIWPCNMGQNYCYAVTHILKAIGFLLKNKQTNRKQHKSITLCDVSSSHLTQEAASKAENQILPPGWPQGESFFSKGSIPASRLHG